MFYRFQKPADERFPAMLELFCRAPDGIKLAEDSRLTPVPIDEAAASLSAILLDDTYYEFILTGRKEGAGLPWVGEDRLIPLKASAWLDLGERQAKGEPVDSKNVCQQARQRRVASVSVAHAGRSHRGRPKDCAGSETLSRGDRIGSHDRSEVLGHQQQRRRAGRTHCQGLRIESTARDVITMK